MLELHGINGSARRVRLKITKPFSRNYFSFPTPKRRLDGGSTRVRHAARIPSHARQPGDALPKARALHSKGA